MVIIILDYGDGYSYMTRKDVNCRLMKFHLFGHFEALNIHDYINGKIRVGSNIFMSKKKSDQAESVLDS